MRRMVSSRAWAACRFATLAVPLSLAACQTVPPPAPLPPPPAPPPVVAPPPPPPPVAAAPEQPWDIAPVAQGDWSYRQDGARTLAWFGSSPANVALVISCDKAMRQISVERSGSAGGPATMTIRTSAGDLKWPAAPGPTAFPDMIAARAASDPGFDWIAFSRGRISVEVSGLPRLIAPAWADISRVIEDCRG